MAKSKSKPGVRGYFSSAVAGRKETGKSTYLRKLADAYIKAHPNKRFLIIDVNGSPAYNGIPSLTYETFPRWEKGLYKFYDPDHFKMLTFIIDLYDKRKNPRSFDGCIVFEDCTKYIEERPDKRIKTFLVDHRMWRADLIFTFHSLEVVPKFFWKMINFIEIFKTQDIFEGRETELRKRFPNWSEMLQTHTRVMNNKDNHYHETVGTLI